MSIFYYDDLARKLEDHRRANNVEEIQSIWEEVKILFEDGRFPLSAKYQMLTIELSNDYYNGLIYKNPE